jgi:hypothetical protein
LHDAFKRYFGKDDAPALVWKASTRVMNETVAQRIIDEAMERDPAAAAAEYLAEFRSDVETFLSREAVDACVSPGIFERPPIRSASYLAFVDPSGGSSDSMTMAVGHIENDVVVLDAIRDRKPPFTPDAVVAEFAKLLRSYRIFAVTGDRYGGDWPADAFRRHGITYRPAGKAKSDVYLELLPFVNGRKVDLLDVPKLTNQLVGLERRTARGGRESIDHAPGAHDDLANAVAGVCYLLRANSTKIVVPIVVFSPRGEDAFSNTGLTYDNPYANY